MTCIAGIARNGRVWIGGDRLGANGYVQMVRRDEKVFRNKDYLIGFTSSYRMGQLLRYRLDPPVPGDDLFRFMVTEFIDSIRSVMKDGGFAKNEDGEETGGDFLVGVRGRLFHIQSDFQVAEPLHSYDACGSGREVALGALYATEDLSPADRIYSALEAAEQYSYGVSSPFDIEVI